MATKTMNDETEIELRILNPAKFQTLQAIRDFVTGDGARALRYAIDRALCPAVNVSEVAETEVKFQEELESARDAAYLVNKDIAALAKGAIESESDPEVVNNEGCIHDKQKFALLFIAFRDECAADEIQKGIIEYLGGWDTVAVTPQPPERHAATDEEVEPEDLSRYVAPGVAAMIHAPVLETAEDVAGYLDADFHSLCRMATDLANAGVALPAMFYEDLGGLAQSAASVLRGEGSGGGRASEPFNYLEPLAAAYASMVRKLEEDPDGDRRSTVVDGVSGEVCRTTMPLLSRLIRDAAVQAEEEWAARHEHAI